MYGELYHRVYHAPDGHHHAQSGRLGTPNLIYMVLCHNVLRFELGPAAARGKQSRCVTFLRRDSARYGGIRRREQAVEVGAKLDTAPQWDTASTR